MVSFILNQATVIINTDFPEEPVVRAVKRFRRDMEMALRPLGKVERGNYGMIRLSHRNLPEDHFRICISERDELVVEAGNHLGIIYGLCYLSRKYLGIQPFWFWNDQTIEKRQAVCVNEPLYEPKLFPVQFRGWVISDEVLLDHWDAGVDSEYPWEMAFEALLRCGGNLVIPGIDTNTKKYEKLAADMGLWITHQQAAPLGAEIFARVHPKKAPSYKNHPLAFHKIWEEAVIRQMDQKVIWNIGYRGQNDVPLWVEDPSFDTPEKRGKILSSIFKQQCKLVKQYVDAPVFCTYVDEEIMELYQQGCLTLPENVILVWSDNGHGKMVSSHHDSLSPRVTSLPAGPLRRREHGVNYHVSFYDHQAACHITMLPNSMEFVEKELDRAYDSGIRSMWLINCSNIKPHVFPLDFISSQWSGSRETSKEQLQRYLKEYYFNGAAAGGHDTLFEKMEACFRGYCEAAPVYGAHEDERAGEQFYNYVTRELACCWVRDGRTPCKNLSWCTGEKTLKDQMMWYRTFCEQGVEGYSRLLEQCREIAGEIGPLWEDSLLLQAEIYYYCIKGAAAFCMAFDEYENKEYLNCFYLLGNAADTYRLAVDAMERSSHDKWKGFYDNECLTDVKETVYLLRRVMSYIRVLGDGPYFNLWQRQVSGTPEDQKAALTANRENHMTDDELYEAMKMQQMEADQEDDMELLTEEW